MKQYNKSIIEQLLNAAIERRSDFVLLCFEKDGKSYQYKFHLFRLRSRYGYYTVYDKGFDLKDVEKIEINSRNEISIFLFNESVK